MSVDANQQRRRLEALYLEHADAIYAYARRRAPVTVAEDVVMEVFVVACRRIEEVPQAALPWLLACARRVLANQRRGALRAEALADRLQDVVPTAGGGDGAAETLAEALEQLSDRDRETVLLSAWEGLDLRELAGVLGCSRGAAAVRLHRARRRLRLALEQAGPRLRESRAAEAAG